MERRHVKVGILGYYCIAKPTNSGERGSVYYLLTTFNSPILELGSQNAIGSGRCVWLTTYSVSVARLAV